jgi:hypothetical protein
VAEITILIVGALIVTKQFLEVISTPTALDSSLGLPINRARLHCSRSRNVALKHFEQNREKHSSFGKDPVVLRV